MSIVHRLNPKAASVGGSQLRRLLPQRAIRQVGPWVFLDHFGPLEHEIRRDGDVRPHPHCGLSTVSFLFDGRIEHRDSTGGHSIVRPGEIHWMRGGHGIVHSERALESDVGTRQLRHGLQLWCAHPDGEEEQQPRFDSWTNLPVIDIDGIHVQLLAGDGWGQRSPVEVTSPLIYAVATMQAGQRLEIPVHEERCIYPVSGRIEVSGQTSAPHELFVVDPETRVVTAIEDCQVAILGGDSIGPRYIWWNLVHSDKNRLKEQAQRWRNGEFPAIAGDNEEFIPAPELGP